MSQVIEGRGGERRCRFAAIAGIAERIWQRLMSCGAANVALLLLALASVHWPVLALIAAVASVAVLLVLPEGLARRRPL